MQQKLSQKIKEYNIIVDEALEKQVQQKLSSKAPPEERSLSHEIKVRDKMIENSEK